MKSVALTALLLLCACTATSVPPTETVEIFKHDGSRQCESSGTSPEAMQAGELNGITVHNARKGVQHGIAFPAVCGGFTSNINIYRISKQDLQQAQQRGFELMTPQHQGLLPR